LIASDAGVVDEYVYASVPLQSRRDHLFHGAAIADVHRGQFSGAPTFLDSGDGRIRVTASRGSDNVRTARGKHRRNPMADAAGGAGDEGDFTRESEHQRSFST
jgi:hypothetical protein